MEVASVFTSDKDMPTYLYEFLRSYDKLYFLSKDDDTAYFGNISNKKNELYYHFKLDDIEYEFGYNYSEDEIKDIKNYFSGQPFYLFDISFRDKVLFSELLLDFGRYLKEKEKSNCKILISDPFEGLKSIVE